MNYRRRKEDNIRRYWKVFECGNNIENELNRIESEGHIITEILLFRALDNTEHWKIITYKYG